MDPAVTTHVHSYTIHTEGTNTGSIPSSTHVDSNTSGCTHVHRDPTVPKETMSVATTTGAISTDTHVYTGDHVQDPRDIDLLIGAGPLVVSPEDGVNEGTQCPLPPPSSCTCLIHVDIDAIAAGNADSDSRTESLFNLNVSRCTCVRGDTITGSILPLLLNLDGDASSINVLINGLVRRLLIPPASVTVASRGCCRVLTTSKHSPVRITITVAA